MTAAIEATQSGPLSLAAAQGFQYKSSTLVQTTREVKINIRNGQNQLQYEARTDRVDFSSVRISDASVPNGSLPSFPSLPPAALKTPMTDFSPARPNPSPSGGLPALLATPNFSAGENQNEAAVVEPDDLGGRRGISKEDLKLIRQMIAEFLERHYGIRLYAEERDAEPNARAVCDDIAAQIRAIYEGIAPAGRQAENVFDVQIRQTELITEKIEFSMKLTAQSTDESGQTVTQSLNIRVRSSSTTLREIGANFSQGNAKDPLVLDLSGTGLDLRGLSEGAVFDLDADGHAERIAGLADGTALLWLDRNGNGRLDDGRELFGDQHGATDGFGELRRFDENSDGWIDAKDDVFGRLRLRTSSGADLTLAEAGVAAIGVEQLKVGVHLGDSAGSLDGVGVFRRANGSLGLAADVLLARE